MNRLIILMLLFHYVHLTTLNGARICYRNHNPNALRKSCSICKQLDNSHTFYQLRIHIACANLARHGCCSTNYQSERRISEQTKVNEAFSQLIMSLQLIQKKLFFLYHTKMFSLNGSHILYIRLQMNKEKNELNLFHLRTDLRRRALLPKMILSLSKLETPESFLLL